MEKMPFAIKTKERALEGVLEYKCTDFIHAIYQSGLFKMKCNVSSMLS